MNIRNKRNSFASILAFQAAAFCFVTSSFSCDYRVQLQITENFTEKESDYAVFGSKKHSTTDAEKMRSRCALTKLLKEAEVSGEYLEQRSLGTDKQQTLVNIGRAHNDEPGTRDILLKVEALLGNGPVVANPEEPARLALVARLAQRDEDNGQEVPAPLDQAEEEEPVIVADQAEPLQAPAPVAQVAPVAPVDPVVDNQEEVDHLAQVAHLAQVEEEAEDLENDQEAPAPLEQAEEEPVIVADEEEDNGQEVPAPVAPVDHLAQVEEEAEDLENDQEAPAPLEQAEEEEPVIVADQEEDNAQEQLAPVAPVDPIVDNQEEAARLEALIESVAGQPNAVRSRWLIRNGHDHTNPDNFHFYDERNNQ